MTLIITRHFTNQNSLKKINIKGDSTSRNTIIGLNIFITIFIFFTSFFVVDLNKNLKDSSNSIKLTLYFAIYYLLNILILSFRIHKKRGKISIGYFDNSYNVYRIEIYLLALVINFMMILFENTLTKSMYNAFTFLIILDTFTLLLFKQIKNYIAKEEDNKNVR